MANLETLFIEIDGNASKASGGITNLIGSLSALGTEIGRQLGSIQSLASALKDIRSASVGGNIWKNLTPASSSTSQVKKATEATKGLTQAWAEANKIIPQNNGQFTSFSKAKLLGFNSATGKYDASSTPNPIYGKGIKAADALGYNKSIPSYTGDTWKAVEVNGVKVLAKEEQKAVPTIKEYNDTIKETASNTVKAGEATKGLASDAKEVKEATRTLSSAKSKVTSLTQQIGRIAKTMLIRTALRALMKAAKEGLNNFYKYSKEIGSSYATAMDSLAVKAGTAKNQIGAALGTLLASVAPILNTIISLATAAASALSALFSLFGGGTTFSKATDGMNSFAKAAGGGGSAMKELLADFDEFNIIASEGGGGGGGGGNFSAMFEESPIPQWMIEWQPLINAVVAGTLGAIILPKIFNWIKKIMDLFSGGGATNLLNILKNWWKKNPIGDDDENPSISIKGLDDTLSKTTLLAGETEIIKKNLKEISETSIPDLGKLATDCGIIAGALTIAAPMAEKLSGALASIKTILDGGNLISTVVGGIASLLMSALSSVTAKVKVDKKEYEEFKKAHDEWVKKAGTKNINVSVNRTQFDSLKSDVNSWVNITAFKNITVSVNMVAYGTSKNALDAWLKNEDSKSIKLVVNTTSLTTAKSLLAAWIATIQEKNVKLVVNTASLTAAKALLNTWISTKQDKNVKLIVNTTSLTTAKSLLNAWISTKQDKNVKLVVNTSSLTTAKSLLATWIATKQTKNVSLVVSTTSLTNAKSLLAAWIATKQTKNVTLTVDTSSLTQAKNLLNAWVATKPTKNVTVKVDMVAFGVSKNTVDSWANTTATKKVKVQTAEDPFSGALKTIVDWLVKTAIKKVEIQTTENPFNGVLKTVVEWITKSTIKTITIRLEKAEYEKAVSAIDKWVKETATKTIYVDVIQRVTTQTGTGNNKTNTNGKTNTNTGLNWTLNEGLTYNGKNVLDTAVEWVASLFKANGAYGIPSGDLFIANEAGAELVGSINGKTSVANQGQIIEGIQRGVAEANESQNVLLRQQNELLRRILDKDSSVRLNASAALGRVTRQSLDMYSGIVGG